jgi:hypothetical protein
MAKKLTSRIAKKNSSSSSPFSLNLLFTMSPQAPKEMRAGVFVNSLVPKKKEAITLDNMILIGNKLGLSPNSVFLSPLVFD